MGDDDCEPIDLGRLHVEAFCNICGRPLYTHEIRAIIEGKFTDYVERTTGSARLYLCDECFETMIEYASEDINGARRRYLEDHECHVTDVKTESGD
jgi:hypothetical protein